jgi:hypothetical protein
LSRDAYLNDVSLLHLEVAEDIGESLQCNRLARTDVLSALESTSVYDL